MPPKRKIEEAPTANKRQKRDRTATDTDFTLQIGDKSFDCHRDTITSASKFLKNALEEIETNNYDMTMLMEYLHSVDHFKIILDYMYGEDITTTDIDTLAQIASAADFLGVDDLFISIAENLSKQFANAKYSYYTNKRDPESFGSPTPYITIMSHIYEAISHRLITHPEFKTVNDDILKIFSDLFQEPRLLDMLSQSLMNYVMANFDAEKLFWLLRYYKPDSGVERYDSTVLQVFDMVVQTKVNDLKACKTVFWGLGYCTHAEISVQRLPTEFIEKHFSQDLKVGELFNRLRKIICVAQEPIAQDPRLMTIISKVEADFREIVQNSKYAHVEQHLLALISLKKRQKKLWFKSLDIDVNTLYC
jgi:HEPN domain-containing protein